MKLLIFFLHSISGTFPDEVERGCSALLNFKFPLIFLHPSLSSLDVLSSAVIIISVRYDFIIGIYDLKIKGIKPIFVGDYRFFSLSHNLIPHIYFIFINYDFYNKLWFIFKEIKK